MTKVVALEKGYYKKIRNPGDRFEVPFSEGVISKSKWLALDGTRQKPKPERRFVPDGRSAPMVDVLKGIPTEDYNYEEDNIETMSQMTAAISEQESTHARAYGLEQTEQPKKRGGRPKGSKNKPKQEEVTP